MQMNINAAEKKVAHINSRERKSLFLLSLAYFMESDYDETMMAAKSEHTKAGGRKESQCFPVVIVVVVDVVEWKKRACKWCIKIIKKVATFRIALIVVVVNEGKWMA
jgi:hypothetical protein